MQPTSTAVPETSFRMPSLASWEARGSLTRVTCALPRPTSLLATALPWSRHGAAASVAWAATTSGTDRCWPLEASTAPTKRLCLSCSPQSSCHQGPMLKVEVKKTDVSTTRTVQRSPGLPPAPKERMGCSHLCCGLRAHTSWRGCECDHPFP